MLLLSPLGSVKSKLIVLQDCVEWVSKSSCWAVCGCRVSRAPSPWAVIDFGLLNSGLWRLVGGKSLQSVLGSSVAARSRKGQLSLQTQLGPDSAPLQSQGKIPPSVAAPRPGFRTQPLLVRRPTNVPVFVTRALRNTLCCHETAKQLVRKGKETGKRIMSPPELNSDQWPVYVRLCPSRYSYLEPSNSSDQIIWLLWAAVTFKLNKVQLLETLMKNIKLRLCFIRYQEHCFNSPPPKFGFFLFFVLRCAFHPRWLQFLVKISWAMKGWPTRLWIAFYMMWVPEGPILPIEVRMIAINVYRKYVSVHKEKGEPQTGLSGL